MNEYKLTPAKISEEFRSGMAAEDLPALAARFLDADAWLLAETPRKVYFEPYAGSLPGEVAGEYASIVIFGPGAEIRLEREPGQSVGIARVIYENPEGREVFMRMEKAFLRDEKKGRLKYAEYFADLDGSGFLQKLTGRLAGVSGAGGK